MNKPNADIELIRKYFNGELNPADQHELEKRALDNPFLQDAMDGFEATNIKQSDLNDLENRLAQRLEKKEKIVAIWGFKQWSIAASLIFGIAAISIYFNQTPENETIAVSELQKQERLPKSVKILEDTLATAEEDAVTDMIINSPSVVQNNTPTAAQTKEFSPAEEITIEPLSKTSDARDTIINQIIASNYQAQAKKTESASTSLLAAKFKAEELPKQVVEPALTGRLSGVSIARNRNQNAEKVLGKVISTEDGLPLPGVQITNTKKGETVITDTNGEFKIEADEKDILTAKYLGFLTETIVVNKKDSLNISLQADQKSLSEVVITGYGTKKPNEILAGPKGGWKEFRKYLDENAILESRQKGKVLVQFIIQPDGKLSNFIIQKSLNSTADNKAIQIIKNYPTWFGSADGEAQKVKVAVRFK